MMTGNLKMVPITHPAQKQALMDLLTTFEQQVDVTEVTQEDIDRAQAAVANDMGW